VRFQNNSSALIEDCEIYYDAPTAPDAIIGGAGSFTIRRCNIHHFTEGPRLTSGCVVEDSWIHSPVRYPGGHIDGLQMTAGSDVTIRHNVINMYDATTGDYFNSTVIIKADAGPISNIAIVDNVLNGGNYTVYLVSMPAPNLVSTVAVSGNRFGPNHQYGTHQVVNVAGLSWTASNVIDATNQPITA